MMFTTQPTAATAGRSERGGDRWNLVAVVLGAVGAIALCMLPLVSEESAVTMTDASGEIRIDEETRRVSLVESEGGGVLVIASIPALVMAVPLLGRSDRFRRIARVVVTAVIGVLTVLAMASIGMFLIPSLVCMMAAVRASPRSSTAASSI